MPKRVLRIKIGFIIIYTLGFLLLLAGLVYIANGSVRVARVGIRQLTAWVYIAEKYIGQRVSAKVAW